MNVTKTAARRLASIIFNEKCKVTLNDPTDKKDVSKEIKEASEFLEQTLYDNNFYNLFELNLEKGIAVGGFAMRPYIDGDKIKISWIRADQFYPLRSNTTKLVSVLLLLNQFKLKGTRITTTRSSNFMSGKTKSMLSVMSFTNLTTVTLLESKFHCRFYILT